MRLTIVGCAGSYPSQDSPASCYLVEHEGHRLLLDLGNGAIGAVQKYADIYDIDAVVISHLHVDHCIDLCSYYVARKYHPGGPLPRIPVLGPEGTADRMASAYDLPDETGMHEEFEFRDHVDSTQIGPFGIRTVRVDHPVPAYAIRVEAGGRSLVYSGDTGPTQSLIDLATGADLALFEASFLEGRDNPPHLHLTALQAADHATAAGVNRLVLTHLVAWNDPQDPLAEAASYVGDLSIASPGTTYEI